MTSWEATTETRRLSKRSVGPSRPAVPAWIERRCLEPSEQLHDTTCSAFGSGNVGIWRLTLTKSTTSTVTLNVFTVYGSIGHFAVSGYPSPATAGSSNTLTVTAQDASNNTVDNYTGTVSFTSSDSNASLPSSYTFTSSDHGVHTFDATFKTAGTQSISATDGAGKTGSQSSISVNARAFTKLQLLMPGETAAAGTGSGKTGSPSAQTAGGQTVTATDATDATDGSKTANTGTSATVNAGAFTKTRRDQVTVACDLTSNGSQLIGRRSAADIRCGVVLPTPVPGCAVQ